MFSVSIAYREDPSLCNYVAMTVLLSSCHSRCSISFFSCLHLKDMISVVGCSARHNLLKMERPRRPHPHRPLGSTPEQLLSTQSYIYLAIHIITTGPAPATEPNAECGARRWWPLVAKRGQEPVAHGSGGSTADARWPGIHCMHQTPCSLPPVTQKPNPTDIAPTSPLDRLSNLISRTAVAVARRHRLFAAAHRKPSSPSYRHAMIPLQPGETCPRRP